MTPPAPAETSRPSVLSYLLAGAALWVFIDSFPVLSPLLLSFLLILLIALALNPVVSRMRTMTGGRKVATSLLATALVGIIALTGWGFCAPIKASALEIARRLPDYWQRLQRPLASLERQMAFSDQAPQARGGPRPALSQSAVPAARQPAQEPDPHATAPGSILSGLGQMMQAVAGSLKLVALTSAQIGVVLVTVFFGVTFTLMNPRPIFGALFSLVPERHHDQALTIMQRVGRFVPQWAKATLLGMSTIGLLVFLIMWPIFGFADALVLGLIAGVLESVPYLGPLLGAVPGLLLGLSQGGLTPVWVALAYGGIQALENNVIQPLILARGVKAHPVAVIFSLLLSVSAFGVLGALVAAPLVAIVHILHDELYRKRFLPTVTQADLDRLARKALHERPAADP